MAATPELQRRAWQPLTPRGVAAFAEAPWRRLLLVQFVFAILAAAAVVWFLSVAWFPAVTAAIRRLPDRGEIRAGSLNWNADSPQSLAENHFLALMLEKDLAQDLCGEGKDERLHVLGVDMVGERLIVVAERAAAPNDLMPFGGSHQRYSGRNGFLCALATLEQRGDVGLKGAGDTRQRGNGRDFLSGLDLRQIALGKAEFWTPIA